jgi:hypothetical protein
LDFTKLSSGNVNIGPRTAGGQYETVTRHHQFPPKGRAVLKTAIGKPKFAANNPGAGSAGRAEFGGAVVRPERLIFSNFSRLPFLVPTESPANGS